jgi:hypothetical protein
VRVWGAEGSVKNLKTMTKIIITIF